LLGFDGLHRIGVLVGSGGGGVACGAALVCLGVQSIPGTAFQFDLLLGPLLSFVCGVRAVFLDAFKKRDDCPALCLADSVFVFLVNLIQFFLYW
jgi:hypothetical protein